MCVVIDLYDPRLTPKEQYCLALIPEPERIEVARATVQTFYWNNSNENFWWLLHF